MYESLHGNRDSRSCQAIRKWLISKGFPDSGIAGLADSINPRVGEVVKWLICKGFLDANVLLDKLGTSGRPLSLVRSFSGALALALTLAYIIKGTRV